jgi:hypothetical protein
MVKNKKQYKQKPKPKAASKKQKKVVTKVQFVEKRTTKAKKPLSIDDLYQQTIFNPDMGFCRGIGDYLGETAIADFTTAADINVLAGGYAAALIIPGMATTATNYGHITLPGPLAGGPLIGTSSLNFSDSTAWPTFVQQTMKLAVTQCLALRIRACVVKITPTASITQKGGMTQVAWTDSLALGQFTRAGAGGVGYLGPLTYDAFNGLPFRQTFGGEEPIILHAIPNGDEIHINTNNEINVQALDSMTSSGFIILFQAPAGSATSFHIDARFILEYLPSDAQKPTVTKQLPSASSECAITTNKIIAKNWVPLIMANKLEWESIQNRGIRGFGRFAQENLEAREMVNGP